MFKHFILLLFSCSTYSQITDFESVNFKKADSIAHSLKGFELTNLYLLSKQLIEPLSTDVEKFRAIYVWVCNNIKNDYFLYKKNSRKREKYANDSIKLYDWNREFSQKAFSKLINEKKTVCTGYAYIIKELANFSNIECEMVHGYGKTSEVDFSKNPIPNHSWNAVKLDNKWYLCDATWSSGVFDFETNRFEFDFNEGYFLTEPNLYLKNHFPLKNEWRLTEEKVIKEDFFNYPILYGEAFKYALVPVNPLKMQLDIIQGNELKIILNENNTIDLDALSVELVSKNKTFNEKPKIKILEKGLIEIGYTLNSTGYYDFHLKYKEDYICSYSIDVKKD